MCVVCCCLCLLSALLCVCYSCSLVVLLLRASVCAVLCVSVCAALCVSVCAALCVVCFSAGVGGGGCALCGRVRAWIGLYFFQYFLRKKKIKSPMRA